MQQGGGGKMTVNLFFFSDYLSKNAIDLENSFFFFYSKWIVLIEMKCS